MGLAPVVVESLEFAGALVLVTLSSFVLATSLERIGDRFGFTQALLGIVTALGADSPEISSAITAIQGGQHDVGVGIVFGSNLFNLASLLGLSALIAGKVRVRTETAWLNGTVAIVVTLVAAALVLGLVPIWSGVATIGVVFVPYVVLAALGPARLGMLAPLGPLHRYLRAALSEGPAGRAEPEERRPASLFGGLAAIPALTSIVLGSVVMVHTATDLGTSFGISGTIVGTIVLAGLTGIPNAVAALRLARRGRGPALVAEAFNSNSLNLMVGIFLTVLLTGPFALSRAGVLSTWWLLGLTLAAIATTLRKSGVDAREGALLVGAYAAFVVMLVA